MVLDSILGGLLGGVLRLVPEVLNILDKKNERGHEIKLGDQQYRVAELQFRQQREIKDLDVEQAQFTTAMDALKSSIASQGTKTGIAWIDGIVALVRPSITTWIFVLYTLVKLAALETALRLNDAAVAVQSIWGPEDSGMLSAVIMFWFVGRVWDRTRPRTP
jgi:hypothetical protein